METRANYALVGLFSLAVIVAAFGFVYWFSGGTGDGQRASYRVEFTGTVSGLRTGGSVLFNGIKVGEVTDLTLDPQRPGEAIATIAIDRRIPIRADTQASLEYQGLTGIASIALRGGRADAPALPAPEGALPTLRAEANGLQDLAQGARELVSRADSVVRRVDSLLRDNDAAVRNIVRNADRFMGALGDNADDIGNFMKDAGAAARRIASLSENIDKLAADLSGVVKAVDPARVASFVEKMDTLAKAIDAEKLANVVNNAETFTKGLADSTEKVTKFAEDAQALATRLKAMAEKLDPTIDRFAGVAEAVDPEKVKRTVENVDRFTASLGRNAVNVDSLLKDAADVARKFNDMSGQIDSTLRRINDVAGAIDPGKIDRALGNVDKFTESLGKNAEKVDTMLADAAEIARKFNEMTPRIDRILANVEGLTGSPDGKSLLADISEAAKSVQRLAENLDKRVAEISAGLSRFTGQGLREWEALAAEGRRTLSELDRAVRNFDRNPQRVIFGGNGNGGGSVPQYGGRR